PRGPLLSHLPSSVPRGLPCILPQWLMLDVRQVDVFERDYLSNARNHNYTVHNNHQSSVDTDGKINSVRGSVEKLIPITSPRSLIPNHLDIFPGLPIFWDNHFLVSFLRY